MFIISFLRLRLFLYWFEKLSLLVRRGLNEWEDVQRCRTEGRRENLIESNRQVMKGNIVSIQLHCFPHFFVFSVRNEIMYFLYCACVFCYWRTQFSRTNRSWETISYCFVEHYKVKKKKHFYAYTKLSGWWMCYVRIENEQKTKVIAVHRF